METSLCTQKRAKGAHFCQLRRSIRAVCMGAIICTASILYSCTDPFMDTMTYALPQWPPENDAQAAYPPLICWEISYYDGVSFQTQTVSAETRSISFSTGRNFPCPLVAQPITKHGEKPYPFFKPAGCIPPFHPTITWEDGWAAQVAYVSARMSGENFLRFNWNKLVEAVRTEQMAQPGYNPWWWHDPEATAQKVQAGTADKKVAAGKTIYPLPVTDVAAQISPAPHAALAGSTVLSPYIASQQHMADSDAVFVPHNVVVDFLFAPETVLSVRKYNTKVTVTVDSMEH
ncbi:MAG: hypothetical protein IJ191_10345 [Treponema sp.]|nr:hypothetical protein [Treponema sp.]